MNIIVVGAGIGGLAFALSAHRLGLSVRLYKSVAQLLPLGVGINLQPNAVRELTELGLGDMLAKIGIPTAELAYYSKLGQRIWSEPRGVAAGYKWPQYSIHRGALQLGLLDAVRERLGSHAVTTGHHLHGFERDGTSIRARFVDRATGTALATVEADVLIGADGIHSMVRKTLYPDEGLPKYGKWVLFRGAVKSDPFLSGKTMVSVGTRDQRVVAYPISREALDRGKALINWVASLPMPTTGALPPEEWNRKVGKELFLPEFESWRFPWLDVAAIIEQTADVYQFPFVDREPIPRWSVGRVTLLGDAAHPMYPIGSQAGSQAIIDARSLGVGTGRIRRSSGSIAALRRHPNGGDEHAGGEEPGAGGRECPPDRGRPRTQRLLRGSKTSSAGKSWRKLRSASRNWQGSTSRPSTTANLFWNDLKFPQASHLPVCPKASGQTLAPTVANKQC